MTLAERITIKLGAEEVELRPSLRCAIRLERRTGSFAKLASDVMDGSLTAAVEIVRDHTDMPFLEARVLDALATIRDPLLTYVMALAGIDAEDAPANDNGTSAKSAGPRKSIPFRDYLAGLYRIGTGWLGWTPDTTLDATPAEISEAYQGRLDMLKAIFGGSDQTERPSANASLDDRFRQAFGSIGTVKVQRKKKAA